MKLLLKLLALISVTLFILSCDSTEPTDPPINNPAKWEVIPALADVDVRYILKFDNTIYLTGLVTGKSYRGVIWKTTDGNNWTLMRTFEKAVGPLAINGDSLYCLGDSLFRYIILLNKWENVCQPYPLNTDVQAVSEMIFLGDSLYAFQNYFEADCVYKIRFNGEVENLASFYSYRYFAKLIKINSHDNWCYARGRYHSGGFYIFNMDGYSVLTDGLIPEVIYNQPTNSMEIRNDTLFAGFRYPGIIKYLDQYNVWRNYTDSIPCVLDSTSLNYIEPTEITCIRDRMFVSTDVFGVMEWRSGVGWLNLSEGLKTYYVQNYKVYFPIVFLENIDQTLIAAYGAPGYAAWGGNGVYRLKINN